MKILHVFTLATTAETFFDGQFSFLAENGYEIILTCSTKPKESFCKKNKLKFINSHIERRIDVHADLKAIYETISLIKREKPKAIFGHTPKGALIAMISGWLAGVPKRVYYRHGLIYTTSSGIKRKIFKFIEQITAIFATHIINVSPSLSRLAVEDHLNGEKKQIIIGEGTCGGIDAFNTFNPNKIDSAKLESLRSQYGINDDDCIIGFCGRLCKDKGIEELLSGFRIITNRYPSIKFKLLLVGPFDDRDILSDSIQYELKNSSDIICTGGIFEYIQYFYAMMDIFVFPSYREGFGMCVLEASAMEKPVLVSRSHGCVDSIENGITGEYIDLSAEGVANGIERMLLPDYRDKLGKGGRQRVLENFEHRVMWPKILKIYKDFLKL